MASEEPLTRAKSLNECGKHLLLSHPHKILDLPRVWVSCNFSLFLRHWRPRPWRNPISASDKRRPPQFASLKRMIPRFEFPPESNPLTNIMVSNGPP